MLLKSVIIILSISLYIVTNSLAEVENEAKIIYLKGAVKVQHKGEASWFFAQKGMILKDNDKIKTAGGSEAEVSLDFTLKNIVKIEANTELTIEDLRLKKLHLAKGKVLAAIESLPQGSSFELRTPTAVAGVAGSGISAETDGKKTNVGCFEDKAYVRGIDEKGMPMAESFIIDEGYGRIVDRFQVPGEPAALTAFEKEQWSQFRENLNEHVNSIREEKTREEQRGAGAEEGGEKTGAATEAAEDRIGGDVIERVIERQERSEDRSEVNKDNVFEQREDDKRDKATERPPRRDDEGGRYIGL